MIDVGDDPTRWVASDGRPARCLDYHHGMPSYETADTSLMVFDLLVVNETGVAAKVGNVGVLGRDGIAVPRSYGRVTLMNALIDEHEFLALYDAEDAVWQWRPVLYQLRESEGVTRLGSQHELDWRQGLVEFEMRNLDIEAAWPDIVVRCHREGKTAEQAVDEVQEYSRKVMARPLEWSEANERAKAILRENLNPQQTIDLDAWGCFYVRGVANRLYCVRVGNGVAIVDPLTLREVVSVCVHPETWMPHEDVALASKLLIDSGVDGERELLEGGKATPTGARRRPATAEQRYAWDVGRNLLPEPLETIS